MRAWLAPRACRALLAGVCALAAVIALAACDAPWGSSEPESQAKVRGLDGGPGSGEGNGGGGGSSSSASGGAAHGGAGGAAPKTPLSSIPDFSWNQEVSPKLLREALRVRRLVVDMIEMTNAGDPAVCTRIFTRHHLENVTGETGPDAIAKCTADIAASAGNRTIVAFESLRIDRLVTAEEGVPRVPTGHRLARVQFVTAEDGQEERSRLDLLRADGPYKVYRALPPENPSS